MSATPTKSLRKTKIIVTLGESSSSKQVLVDLIRAGMDVARISNRFLKEDKQTVLDNLKEAMKETNTQIAVMLGLRESDIRIGTFNKASLNLNKGDIVRITSNVEESEKMCSLWCNNKHFESMVAPGDKLLVDFGKVILSVLTHESLQHSEELEDSSFCLPISEPSSPQIDSSKSGNIMFLLNSSKPSQLHHSHKKALSLESIQRFKRPIPKLKKPSKVVRCRVENDCLITAHKPVHISSSGKIDTPESDLAISEDFQLLEWAENNNIDFIVFKQVKDNEDLDFLLRLTASSSKKFLGLQTKSALSVFEKFVDLWEGVVLGRGTLAFDTSLAEVCRIQKEIVHRCNFLAKPVVISTQLLESMVLNPSPTRSEVTDVTNAVLDGADALMLSGETAYGLHPVKALEACSRICLEAEKVLEYQNHCKNVKELLGNKISITENTCFLAVTTVLGTGSKVIVCLTESGNTAQIISKFMPPCSIVALTNSVQTLRHLRIVRGVYPFLAAEVGEAEILEKIFEIVKANEFAQDGDSIVLVGGLLHNFAAAATCSLRILTVK